VTISKTGGGDVKLKKNKEGKRRERRKKKGKKVGAPGVIGKRCTSRGVLERMDRP